MGKKIKLNKPRKSWEPPPSMEEKILPFLIGLAILFILLPFIIR